MARSRSKRAQYSAQSTGFSGQRYGKQIAAEDVLAYIAAVAAHPAFTERFRSDLVTPGFADPAHGRRQGFRHRRRTWRTVIWLHTFGERFVDAKHGRPAEPPRLPPAQSPRIPKAGAISQTPQAMPDTIEYDASQRRLSIGQGYIENVSPQVWNYEVSGKHVLRQWFSYRKANRDRPIIGDRRPPSPLGDIRPDHWLAEYTSELLNVLHVLGRLVELEPTKPIYWNA